MFSQTHRALAGVILALIAASFSLAPGLAAQDSHYWSNQYGNRSMLLSGAVIGSVSDLGAVFYNPARLGHLDNPAFVLTAKVYQWDRILIEDGLGDQIDLRDSNFGGAPSLAAGTFTVPFLEGHTFAYSFLSRHRSETNLFLRAEREGEVVDAFPGDDILVGVVGGGAKLQEEWIGLSWAKLATERLSVGITANYYNHSRQAKVDMDLRALGEAGQVGAFLRERFYNVKSQGLLAKIGLSWDSPRVQAGVTVTTPHWAVLSNGSIRYEDLLAGVDTTGDGTPDDVLVSSVQRDLASDLVTPWAAGAGVGLVWGRGTLHLTGEWYSGVDEYSIMRANPVEGQSTGEPLEFEVVDERSSVLNWGVGFEWEQSETFSAYGSMATNNSGAPEDITLLSDFSDIANVNAIRSDFLQFGGGFAIETSWAELTLGLTYAFTEQDTNRAINFPDGGDEPIIGADEIASWRISQWRFLLGFSIPFADNLADRVKGEGEV